MTKLFLTPTSCGAASYISAKKAGILNKLSVYVVDLQSHKITNGDKKGHDFYEINAKGNVPTLLFDNGVILNENAATLQWIADQNPQAKLAPANGTLERYVLQSKLSFVSSEIHASVGPLFNPTLSPQVREFAITKYKTKLEFLNKELTGKTFYVGDHFTIVDAYLYIILTWTPYVGLDLSPYPAINDYFKGIQALDFIKEAHAELNQL